VSQLNSQSEYCPPPIPAPVVRATRPDSVALSRSLKVLPSVMEKLGYTDFKSEGQRRTIYNLLSCKDTICVLPTSGGKTACYMIPSLCTGWPTLVFSPLKALMQDQQDNLTAAGCRAAAISSANSQGQNMAMLDAWSRGDIDFLLVAPERIHSDSFRAAMDVRPPRVVAIDEAHVGSDWSESFRPEYARLGQVIDAYKPQTVVALTATAPAPVLRDIRRIYRLGDATLVSDLTPRENLKLSSSTELCTAGVIVRDAAKRWGSSLLELGSMIIYCATRKRVDEITFKLKAMGYQDKVQGYHGGMGDAERISVMRGFMEGSLPIIVATNAFGMGVNKPDIRYILHADAPSSIESLQQEMGRAGRDGKDSFCHLYFSSEAISIQRFLRSLSYPVDYVAQVWNALLRLSDRGTLPVRMTQQDIAEYVGVPSAGMISSIYALLAAQKFITSSRPKSDNGYVINGSIEGLYERSRGSENLNRLVNALVPNPFKQNDHMISPENLKAAFKASSYSKALKEFKAECKGLNLVIVPPYRGSEVRVNPERIDDQVDLREWQRKVGTGEERLQHVADYANLDDKDKHPYLANYFTG
jgi:ATP-dependent DNA helicase RecQ